MEYAKDIILDFKKGQAINVRTKKVSLASKVLDKILKLDLKNRLISLLIFVVPFIIILIIFKLFV